MAVPDQKPEQAPAVVDSAVVSRITAPLDITPSNRFLLPRPRSYAPQYAHIYFCRLQQLRPHADAAARAAFGPPAATLRYAATLADAAAASAAAAAATGDGKRGAAVNGDKLRGGAVSAGRGNCDEDKADVKDGTGFTVVTGLVFRQMKLKPSILALYEKPSPTHLVPSPPAPVAAPFAAQDDVVFLEDNHARCALDLTPLLAATSGTRPICCATTFVTGVVLALRGCHDHTTGVFSVHAVAYVQPAPQKSLPPPASMPSAQQQHPVQERKRRLVCLVSSLGLSPSAVAPDLLLESLRGTVIDMETAASVAHAIIIGNLAATTTEAPSEHAAVSLDKGLRLSGDMVDADRFVCTLASSLPVTLMPGEGDAANALLPQQPLHRCLLPNAARCANLHRVPNPLACTIGPRAFLGTSGQNVRDMALYETSAPTAGGRDGDSLGDIEMDDAADKGSGGGGTFEAKDGKQVLDVLEAMLRHRHLAPTCPDTLGCYPFTERDPFVIDETPHVFFAGNQREFATRLMSLPADDGDGDGDAMQVEGKGDGQEKKEQERQVRLISVPRFDKTGTAVFVDVDTLDCTVRQFQVL